MILSELFTGSAVSIDATERSLLANGGTTAGVPQAIDAARTYRVYLKLASVAAADSFIVRCYRAPTSGGGQEVVAEYTISFAMAKQLEFEFSARYDADITIQRTAGSSRSGTWSVEAYETGATVAQIADGVWDEDLTGHAAASSAGEALTDAAAGGGGGPSAADIADAVWDEALAGHVGAGSAGEALDAAAAGGGGGPSAADIADAVWDEVLSGHAGAGSTGEALAGADADSATALTAIAAVQADTDNIQTRLPAALVSGRMDSHTGDMASNVITAAALSAGAGVEVAQAVWDRARASHVTAGTFGEGMPLLDGGITAAKLAADAITAAKVAADVTTEFQAGLATSAQVDTLEASAAAIEADTQDIQSRLPVALVGGRIDASVGAVAANAITAAGLHADVATELQAGVATEANVDSIEAAILAAVAGVQADTDNLQTRLPAALVSGRIDASVGAMAADVMTAAAAAADFGVEVRGTLATSAEVSAVAAAVADVPTNAELATALDPIATAAEVGADGNATRAAIAALSIPTAAAVAAQVWDEVSEVGETFGDTVRLIVAALVGRGVLPDPETGLGPYAFRDRADTKDRIAGEVTADERTIDTRDGT
jgi:lipopolysaccharide export system protein LptC